MQGILHAVTNMNMKSLIWTPSLAAFVRRFPATIDNAVERALATARINSISNKIRNRRKFVQRRAEFERDLAAFTSMEEYLKTKIHGCLIFVHFHHDGETLPVDVGELKRSRIRPVQVFEYGKDPIQNPLINP